MLDPKAARSAVANRVLLNRLYAFFMYIIVSHAIASLLVPALIESSVSSPGGPCMFDVLILVLGGGGILLMAAYAALCERI